MSGTAKIRGNRYLSMGRVSQLMPMQHLRRHRTSPLRTEQKKHPLRHAEAAFRPRIIHYWRKVGIHLPIWEAGPSGGGGRSALRKKSPPQKIGVVSAGHAPQSHTAVEPKSCVTHVDAQPYRLLGFLGFPAAKRRCRLVERITWLPSGGIICISACFVRDANSLPGAGQMVWFAKRFYCSSLAWMDKEASDELQIPFRLSLFSLFSPSISCKHPRRY